MTPSEREKMAASLPLESGQDRFVVGSPIPDTYEPKRLPTGVLEAHETGARVVAQLLGNLAGVWVESGNGEECLSITAGPGGVQLAYHGPEGVAEMLLTSRPLPGLPADPLNPSHDPRIPHLTFERFFAKLMYG